MHRILYKNKVMYESEILVPICYDVVRFFDRNNAYHPQRLIEN